MKTCEVCGTSEGRISGKTGKLNMDLCPKHYQYMNRHSNTANALKSCEVCGSTYRVCGKKGKFKMDLCMTHMHHMERYGEILSNPCNGIKKSKDNIITMHNTYAKITCFGKQDTNVGSFKIDIDDISKFKMHHWHINGAGKYLMASTRINGVLTYAHHLLMKIDGMVVFKNKDTLDYRKNNLMEGTLSSAQQNARISSRNTSGCKGVHWRSRANRWIANITVNTKVIYLGSYSDIQGAIAARKAAEAKYFGDFAYDESRDVTLNKEE